MASTSRTIELIFGGVDNTGGAISSVGRNLDSISGKVGDVTGPLANVTDSILKLDVALAASAAAVTGYAIKISDDFDTAFGEIATLIGQPADNLRDFQDQILKYSETSTASLDNITSATYSAISAGVDYRESLTLIEAAEQLSIAGRADLGSTTTALVSTLNAFGASADEAGGYADNFFTAVQLGQTTIPELASSIGTLAPIASAAGLSFEEMAAAIATITAETGTGTAESITGIRAAITALLKPTSEATKTAADLGIEFNAAALESKGFAGVLRDVQEATGGNTEVIAKLFGSVEALAPVLALSGNASEKFAENLGKFKGNAGSAEQASRQLTDTLGLLSQTLKNNLNSALIGLGANLTDETRSIVESLTSIFNSLGNEIKLDDGAFEPILAGLEGLAQNIDEKLQAIAKNFPEALAGLDLSDLLKAFGDLGTELDDLFTALFGNIDLTTVEGLESALQRVVDAFTGLVNVSSGIVSGLEPLFKAIGAGIEQFESLDGSAKKTIGEMLGLAKAIDTVLPVIQGLAGGLGSIGTGLTALAGAQGFSALIGNLNAIQNLGKVGKGGLLGVALGAGYWAGGKLNDFIEEEFGSIGSKLYEYFNAEEIEIAEARVAGFNDELRRGAKDAENINQINKVFARTLGETATAAEATQESWQKYADGLANAGKEQGELDDAMSVQQANLERSYNAVDKLTDSVNKNGGALGDVGETTKKLAEDNNALTLGYDDATGKVNSWSGTVTKSAKSIGDAAEKTKKLFKETDAYKLKLLELQSDERIAEIESKVSLDIAEVEAGAQRVEAIAQTLSDNFKSTGDLIGNLFGGIDDASRTTQLNIEKQIRKENELRKQAAKEASELNQAEIEQIRAKTRQIQSGDALIKVDGQGLQPHLEAFMFEILREIQVRVNADGEEMLLGLN